MDKLDQVEMKKLPVWAQRHLYGAYNEIDKLEADKRDWFGGNQELGQVLLPYFHGHLGTNAEHQYLRHGQRVQFITDANKGTPKYIECYLDSTRGTLMIHGAIGPLKITPQASNVISIELGD